VECSRGVLWPVPGDDRIEDGLLVLEVCVKHTLAESDLPCDRTYRRALEAVPREESYRCPREFLFGVAGFSLTGASRSSSSGCAVVSLVHGVRLLCGWMTAVDT